MIHKEAWYLEAGSLDEGFWRLVRSHTRGDMHTFQRILNEANRIHPDWKGTLPWSVLKGMDLSEKERRYLPRDLGYTFSSVVTAEKDPSYPSTPIEPSEVRYSPLERRITMLQERDNVLLDGGIIWSLFKDRVVYPDIFAIREIIAHYDPEWYRREITHQEETYGQFIPYRVTDQSYEGNYYRAWDDKFTELEQQYGPFFTETIFRPIPQDGATSEEISQTLLRWARV